MIYVFQSKARIPLSSDLWIREVQLTRFAAAMHVLSYLLFFGLLAIVSVNLAGWLFAVGGAYAFWRMRKDKQAMQHAIDKLLERAGAT